MKYSIPLLLLLATVASSFAQLTITDTDVSAALTNARRTTYSVTFDNPKSFNLGLAMSGQTWDFSSAMAGTDSVRDTLTQDYQMPTGLPGAAQFPTATSAVRTDFPPPFPGAELAFIQYLHLENTGLYGLGYAFRQYAPPFLDTLIINKSKPMALYIPLPLTVGTFRTGIDTMQIDGVFFDVNTRTFDADGHGTLTFPNASSRKVIRVVGDQITESYPSEIPTNRDRAHRIAKTFNRGILASRDRSRWFTFIAQDGSLMTFDVLDTAYSTGSTLVTGVSYENKTGTLSVQSIGSRIPDGFNVSQNYPNPFNPSTAISFSIPTKEHVTLKVYNLLGSEVATLVNENLSPGEYRTTLNATNLPSGLYVYRLSTGNFVQTRKMSLIK